MSRSSTKKGILLPPAIGYSFRILIGLVKDNSIPIAYYPRLLAIAVLNLINYPFRAYERLVINPKFKKSPVPEIPIFIIGHWRSGTTHLHNILCRDPRMAYVTTYQSVFPDTLFNRAGRILFEGFMKLLIPGRRKGDNVELSPAFPQEEEFALGDKTPICYYYFWLFPQKMLTYYNSFVRFQGIDPKEIQCWKEDYLLLINKALKNTQGQQFLSKNPAHTGRVKVLLEIFPNAKFIHIHRNPVEVFLSTLHFYKEMMVPLRLQDISEQDTVEAVFEIYKRLMNDFNEQKQYVPAGNLIEVSFDDLESNSEECIKLIYHSLNLNGFEQAKPLISNYFKGTKNYAKNKHIIKRSHLNRIMLEWGFAMERYNYTIPKNIQVTDE